LSPILFAVYMDVLIMRLRHHGLSCKLFDIFHGCLLYTDDILLLSHTVNGMQEMLDICDEFAREFDMKFNATKSVAIRIGSRYNIQCSSFILSGAEIKYVSAVKYLGIYVVAAKCLNCQLTTGRLSFIVFLKFNCIYHKVKATNSELVIVQLLKSYCLPFLLYASEAVSPSHSIVHPLDNCINRAIVKIFHVTSSDCIQTIRHSVGLLHVRDLIEKNV